MIRAKKNKKGWIRIAEAIFAILIFSTTVLLFVVRNIEKPDFSGSMYKLQHAILTEAARNDTIREAVLRGNDADKKLIGDFIHIRLSPGIKFNISINEPSVNPKINLPETDVYVDDIIISSTISTYSPKKLTFFAWVE